ncbi:MAG: arylsulfatase [Opitutaceae bacterium]|nr:arylsulfatase [Opitutaceae bacterium]
MRLRLPFLPTAALLLCGLALAPALPAAAPKPAVRPNLVFIMADDLGYGDLGCFGSALIRTPNLDRLAQQGTRFTHFYAGAPVCAPSRAVLLTGLHTGHARIRGNSPEVGGELESFDGGREGGIRLSFTRNEYTLATHLRSAGYATGATGKWGVGEPGSEGTPEKHGFDEWYGYLNQNHAPYYYTDYLWRNDRREPIPENAGGRHAVYSNDLMADFSIDFVRRHRDQPFFLYLAYTLPHARFEVPDLGAYAAENWPEEAKIYAAMVTRLDGYVGRLMAELDRLGLADRTVIFFTSDNGPAKKPHGHLFNSAPGLRGIKGDVYEGGIRVPMIVRWPGRVPAGRTSTEPWMAMDVFPTLAELAGAPPRAGLDGRSVAAVLTDPAATLGERPLYWEAPLDRLYQAVRLGRWKAVRGGLDQPLELYDLAADPGEKVNVAGREKTVVADLERWLAGARVPSPHWPAR